MVVVVVVVVQASEVNVLHIVLFISYAGMKETNPLPLLGHPIPCPHPYPHLDGCRVAVMG